MLRVLIDTNVILDVLMKREPHFENSYAFLKLCGAQITGLIAASQTTDIFYILRREGTDCDAVKSAIKKLTDNLRVIDVNAADVENALSSDFKDYEDALLAFGGKRHRADFIITRNKKDFECSPVNALSPTDFLERFFSE